MVVRIYVSSLLLLAPPSHQRSLPPSHQLLLGHLSHSNPPLLGGRGGGHAYGYHNFSSVNWYNNDDFLKAYGELVKMS